MSHIEKTLTRSEVQPGYAEFLQEIKTRVQTAQVRAALAINCELVLLYWSIGRDILARQEEQGWGAKIIDCLSTDLRRKPPACEPIGQLADDARPFASLPARALWFPWEGKVCRSIISYIRHTLT